nr:MAG TPA: hypothetical protein [Caudoviricetes sp.]
MSINRKSSKSLYINGFLVLFAKKFVFLKCRKKKRINVTKNPISKTLNL